jgi:hypothetical protein
MTVTLQAMMNLEVIREAYDIAWDYLDRSGAIADPEAAHDELLASLMAMYNAGNRNKLVMANKAITGFQAKAAA